MRHPLSTLAASLLLSLALAPGLTQAADSSSGKMTELEKIDTVFGKGNMAMKGSTVTMHYTGWLYAPKSPKQRGAQFDSTRGADPFTFKLGSGVVIKGWDEGMVGMRVGGKRTLIVPASMGFGKDGLGPVPSTSNLIFDVELIDVK